MKFFLENLHVHLKKAIKNQEKGFRFWENRVCSFFWKFYILRRKYLYSAVNMLTNIPKISDLTKSDFFQLNLSQIYGNIP